MTNYIYESSVLSVAKVLVKFQMILNTTNIKKECNFMVKKTKVVPFSTYNKRLQEYYIDKKQYTKATLQLILFVVAPKAMKILVL